jgi:hypothetical protein
MSSFVKFILTSTWAIINACWHNNSIDVALGCFDDNFRSNDLVLSTLKISFVPCWHYEKKGCFATSLATQFLNCIWDLQLTIYTAQFITTQLQLYHNNYFSTTMQLPNDYNHNVMLTSFFIHPSKFNTWQYEGFSWFFLKYWYPSSNMIIHFRRSWIMTRGTIKVAMWHVNWILETYIYIYIYIGRLVHSHR